MGKKEQKKQTESHEPYSCEEISQLLHRGDVPEYGRFLGFMIVTTAFLAELEGRLETEPIQNWIEDEKKKIKALLYTENHQDCFRFFRLGALMLATQCNEAVEQLRKMNPDKKAVDYAIDTLEQIGAAILPDKKENENG